MDDIAKQAMVSKSTALNLFRKYLHITPVNYLINYRLKQAGQLLSKTEKKVSLISSETGFHNVDYFCRLFKKTLQVNPNRIPETETLSVKPVCHIPERKGTSTVLWRRLFDMIHLPHNIITNQIHT